MSQPELYPEAIIWDLDGTLVDSAPDLATALNTLLNEQGQHGHPVETVRPMIGAGVAKLIVGSALFRAGKNFECFLGFLELGFGLGVVRIPIGMKLHRQATIGGFDFLSVSAALYAQRFIIITFCHAIFYYSLIAQKRANQGRASNAYNVQI